MIQLRHFINHIIPQLSTVKYTRNLKLYAMKVAMPCMPARASQDDAGILSGDYNKLADGKPIFR
jgi:hypothetical protein